MTQQTTKYKLTWFEPGDTTIDDVERTRWLTLDSQIFGLFETLGNGVLNGWNLVSNDATLMQIVVSSGSGHVDYVAVQSVDDTTLDLTPSSRNWIYASLEEDSYYNGTVTFRATTSEPDPDDATALLLGYVDTNAETDPTAIADISTDGRKELNFRDSLLQLLKAHRHLGGTDSPTKVDLSTDVQGYLQPSNMAELDASLILKGVLDKNRIPKLDHITDLVDQGILTHAQLDTFVQLLDNVGSRLMGEVSTVDLLKLILALKHVYPTIDDYLVNEVAFIPGISPDDIADMEHTTADVDFRTNAEGGSHTITGTPAPSTVTHTKRWDEQEEFEGGTLDHAVVFGDSVILEAVEERAYVEDFENVSDWTTEVTELADVTAAFTGDTTKKVEGDQSGKLDVGQSDAESALVLKKTFDPQDWTQYGKIVFYIYCDSAEHGDIFFYFTDAVAGAQGSQKVVLERNQATISPTTGLVDWREIVIDVSPYTRADVNSVVFYTSTDAGWSTDIPFALNVDKMFLTTGNRFAGNGTCVFTYGNDFPQLYERVRWVASLPDGTAFRVRTRVSNDEDLLPSAAWSPYLVTSGDAIQLPLAGSSYKYIQIETLFEADDTLRLSPQLLDLMLDFSAAAENFSFDFDTADDWKAGELHNIDADRVPGAITIKNISDLGSYLYGTDGSLRQLNSDLTSRLTLYGSAAPTSFKQMVARESAGFGKLTAVEYAVDGSFLVADPENDRVLEVDRDGTVVWGLMGTYPTEPVNPYSDLATTETAVATTETTAATTETAAATTETATATSTTETAVERTTRPVGCYYDVGKSRLSLMFSADLSDVYLPGNLDVSKIVLKAGTRRVYLGTDNSSAELFGMDRGHEGVAKGTEFFVTSNVLLLTLALPDASAVNSVAETLEPTLLLVSPTPNQQNLAASLTVEFRVENSEFGSDVGIRVSVDGGAAVDLWSVPELQLAGLAATSHTLLAFLIDSNGNKLQGTAAEVSEDFLVGAAADPHVEILSPVDNQTFPGTTATLEFAVYYLPPTAKLRYQVDEDTPEDYAGASPLVLPGLAAGERSITLFLTDASNMPLVFPFAEVQVDVAMVTRNAVAFSIDVAQDAVKDAKGVGNMMGEVEVEATAVQVANVRCPVDVRAVISDRTLGDATAFNVAVAKVGTPSYPNCYLKDAKGFMDGHSVVEFSQAGAVAMSTNDALIARSREEAMTWLGSVEKGDGDEFLIGDAVGQRAIVSVVNSSDKTSQVVWEYKSDRYVSDFARVPTSDFEMEVTESGLPSDTFYLRRDTPLVWINRTSGNIRVMSGATTPEQFAADPDLTLFGSEFDSGTLAPGESYEFRFINYGAFHFMVWPAILTGTVNVTDSPVSPQDSFVVVENDAASSSYSSRIAAIDAWGNVQWTFGETLVRRIKDARPVSATEVVVSV